MRSNDPDRARREFAEATKNRVVAAVKAQQQAAKAKSDRNSASEASASSIEEPNSIEELTVEFRMMTRLGFSEKARAVEAKLEDLKESTTRSKQASAAPRARPLVGLARTVG